MMFPPEILEDVAQRTRAAYTRINACNIEENIRRTLLFVQSQNAVQIILDGKAVTAVAVDIASVFSPEGRYRQIETPDGRLLMVETMQVLSVVITGENVRLCKATYDVIPASSLEKEKYINARYWATTLDDLTESYIC